jgi:hypothetical protein
MIAEPPSTGAKTSSQFLAHWVVNDLHQFRSEEMRIHVDVNSLRMSPDVPAELNANPSIRKLPKKELRSADRALYRPPASGGRPFAPQLSVEPFHLVFLRIIHVVQLALLPCRAQTIPPSVKPAPRSTEPARPPGHIQTPPATRVRTVSGRPRRGHQADTSITSRVPEHHLVRHRRPPASRSPTSLLASKLCGARGRTRPPFVGVGALVLRDFRAGNDPSHPVETRQLLLLPFRRLEIGPRRSGGRRGGTRFE